MIIYIFLSGISITTDLNKMATCQLFAQNKVAKSIPLKHIEKILQISRIQEIYHRISRKKS